jgi:hypothetical protein
MSTDPNNDAEDQVERAVLTALRRRGDPSGSSKEADDALISAVVSAHLGNVKQDRARRSATHWIGATVLLAAAAAAAFWLIPTRTSDSDRRATTDAQADTSAPTQSMWVLEHAGTPLEGVVVTTTNQACGTRADTRACLTPGSRGTYEADGNLQLHEGTASVDSQGPIVVFLPGVRVEMTTAAASFVATTRSSVWTVFVESGTVTVTGADGASQLLERGQLAGNERVETAKATEPPTAGLDVDEPAEQALAGEKPKPILSAEELLKLARSQRASGDFSAAARTYEQLVRAHPNSTKVRATLVSLAQLYQGPLDDPAKALRHYDRYLEQGGPLAEEAHYGKIRALRSLGRTASAATEVDAFLSAYPDSVHADALRGD